ncbi:MAG: HEAT repeat domain-containing protein, partial [Pyrinomonadaceae bacterium]
PADGFPQAGLFQTPVDIEIGTAAGTRIERVIIEPKEEQSFNFTVDGEPLLVNFDHGDTLIKELTFTKPVDVLIYQLTHDEDVMGRNWAMGQLAKRWNDRSTVASEKEQIATALAGSLKQDKFWGMRVDAAAALDGVHGSAVRMALLAALKDPDAHVRTRAIETLSASKDATLASTYESLLRDQSYAVITAAAKALGETKDPGAFDQLSKLIDSSSWRDTIRNAGLTGLAGLGDPRSLDIAIKYSAESYSSTTRAAAITLLGAAGKKDPRAFSLISAALIKYASPLNFNIATASARALVELGDQRGVAVFEQVLPLLDSPRAKRLVMQLEQQLKDKASGAKPANTN